MRRIAAEAPHRPLLADWPLLAGLVLLWVCLWGSISPLTIVTGAITALVVVRVFELPHVVLPGRLNVWWLAVFLARFLADLVIASVQVAWQAFRALGPSGAPPSALIAVPLRVRNDLLLTLTVVTLSLVPGSIVVDVDRETATLYLHVLGARTEARIAATRESVRRTERRIVLAIGSRADVAAVR